MKSVFSLGEKNKGVIKKREWKRAFQIAKGSVLKGEKRFRNSQ